VLQVLGRSAGGIARHVATVTRSLEGDDRFEVSVAAPSDLPVKIPNIALTIDVPSGPTGHREVTRALANHVVGQGYEVVHAHGIRAGIDTGRAAKGTGAYRILTVHNLVRPEITGRLRAPAYKLAEPIAISFSDHVFAVSQDIASSLTQVRRRKQPPIEVLHLGAGPPPEVGQTHERVRERLEVLDGVPLLVTVARLSSQKALDVLLDALATLPTRPVLAILGEGPLESRLRAHASRLGIEDRVRWLGFRADVADHMAAADVFCLSSAWEGIPLAAMEAIALGTPVVATAVGGMSELISHGVTGRLVTPGDPAALAAGLEEALADSQASQRMAASARAFLAREFSTDRMLERLSEHYLAAVHVA
jgi:glycosyltransferase involved in cell wall biosynthesis